MKLAAWLNEIGLGQYASLFEENELDLDQLIDLTDADMRDLGITIMGHRKRLMRAQSAKPLELRSSADLARLWHADGKTDQARE